MPLVLVEDLEAASVILTQMRHNLQMELQAIDQMTKLLDEIIRRKRG